MKSAIRPHCDVQQATQQIEQINHHHTQIHDPLHHIWEWKVEENTIHSERITYSSYSVKEDNKTKQNLQNTNQPTTTSAFPLCPFLKKRQLDSLLPWSCWQVKNTDKKTLRAHWHLTGLTEIMLFACVDTALSKITNVLRNRDTVSW